MSILKYGVKLKVKKNESVIISWLGTKLVSFWHSLVNREDIKLLHSFISASPTILSDPSLHVSSLGWSKGGIILLKCLQLVTYKSKDCYRLYLEY